MADLAQVVANGGDWFGFAAFITALSGAWVSIQTTRHTATKQKACAVELELMQRKYNHLARHLRWLDRLVGRVLPPSVIEELARDLERAKDQLGDLDDEN